jgi:hypothetical protein
VFAPTSAGEPILLKYVLPLLSGLVGSAIGAVVTWLTAGRKLARERSYERQMEWHVSLHRALAACVLELTDTVIQNQALTLEEFLATKTTPAWNVLPNARADAFLFGSAQLVETLTDVFEEQDRAAMETGARAKTIVDVPGTTLETARSDLLELIRDRSRAVRGALLRAMRETADSHRLRLGLSPLADRAFAIRADE